MPRAYLCGATTLSIMIPSLKDLVAALITSDSHHEALSTECQYAVFHYADCRVLVIVVLNVIMPSVIMLHVIMVIVLKPFEWNTL